MKNDILKILLGLGFILLSITLIHAVETHNCNVNCGPVGVINCESLGWYAMEEVHNCYVTCTKTCGARADCDDDCENCCNNWCSGMPFWYVTYCEDSCEATCDAKSIIRQIREMLYIIAGIFAAIALIINGIKFISSDKPEIRENAKKSMMKVLYALIVVVIGIFIAELIL